MLANTYLIPVRQVDIEIGAPLQYALYDGDRNLLLDKGMAVTSEDQLTDLLNKGLFRERKRPDYSALRKSIKGADTKKEEAEKPGEELVSLDALNLMPGDAVQLQPLADGLEERWTVRVIGHIKPKSLLVTSPQVDDKFIFVKDGQTFLVRAFSGLNVCAFKARVIKAQLQPFPYLHLSWPSSVQAMRIRKNMRAPANIIVSVHETEEGRQTGSGKLVDISVGGAKLLSPATIGKQGQSRWLSFKVKLGDMEEYVKTPAILRTTGDETDEDGNAMRAYGVQFGELNQSQRLIIMNLVYQHLFKEPV